MASAWGLAWADAWNGAWGDTGGSPPPPTPPVADTSHPNWSTSLGGGGKRRRFEFREDRIVEAVAIRQARDLDLDDLQQKEELQRELQLAHIEAESAHFEELAKRREAFISQEIAQRLQKILQEEEAMMMLALVVACE
jgi:hypothetical protein